MSAPLRLEDLGLDSDSIDPDLSKGSVVPIAVLAPSSDALAPSSVLRRLREVFVDVITPFGATTTKTIQVTVLAPTSRPVIGAGPSRNQLVPGPTKCP